MNSFVVFLKYVSNIFCVIVSIMSLNKKTGGSGKVSLKIKTDKLKEEIAKLKAENAKTKSEKEKGNGKGKVKLIVKKKKSTGSESGSGSGSKVVVKPYKVLDLFCGCGGMTQGLVDSGLNVVAGIDVWDKAIDSYGQNFGHTAICADLTKLPPKNFDKLYNKGGKIDIIVGGPPCQGFSIAGKRDIKDPRNSLFIEYVKYLDYFKPKAFIMENVMGILSMKTANGEKVIDIILSKLEVNYKCKVCKLYASDFEVPQNRRRVIIIGVRKDLGIEPTEPVPVISSVDERVPVKTVLLSKDKVDKKFFLSDKAILGIKKKLAKSKAKGHGFGAQFLDMEKPSYTIPARYWKDGYDALVRYNDDEIRRLTVDELKAIQSFPNGFVLEGTKKDKIMQIGNAVASKFAFHLGQHVTKTLDKM